MNDLLILDIIIIHYINSVGWVFFGIFNNRALLATLNLNVFFHKNPIIYLLYSADFWFEIFFSI